MFFLFLEISFSSFYCGKPFDGLIILTNTIRNFMIFDLLLILTEVFEEIPI